MQIEEKNYQKMSLGERVQRLARCKYGRDAAKQLSALTGVDL